MTTASPPPFSHIPAQKSMSQPMFVAFFVVFMYAYHTESSSAKAKLEIPSGKCPICVVNSTMPVTASPKDSFLKLVLCAFPPLPTHFAAAADNNSQLLTISRLSFNGSLKGEVSLLHVPSAFVAAIAPPLRV